MNEEHYYQLIHAVDPTKIKVPIREKFAKLTLSSNKKTKVISPKAEKQQLEKRQSASRNLLESLSNQASHSTDSASNENEGFKNHSLSNQASHGTDSASNENEFFKNPLLRSDSSCDSEIEDINTKLEKSMTKSLERLYPNLESIFPLEIAASKAKLFENSENEEYDDYDDMEPLQVSICLTQEQQEEVEAEDEEKTLAALSYKLSNLTVEYSEIVLSSTEDLHEKTQLISTESQKEYSTKHINESNLRIERNISTSSKNETFDEEEVEIIVLESSADEKSTSISTNITNNDDSFIPPTADTIESNLLPTTLSKEKDERIMAFLKDVSFENREKSKRGLLNYPTNNEKKSNDLINKDQEIAKADTESMTADQESLDDFVRKEIMERKERLLALDDTDPMSSTNFSIMESMVEESEKDERKKNDSVQTSYKEKSKSLPSVDTDDNSFVSALLDNSDRDNFPSTNDKEIDVNLLNSSLNMKILKTPICRQSTILGNMSIITDDEDSNDSKHLERTSVSFLPNIAIDPPEMKTPINRRSTIDMNITNDSFEPLETSVHENSFKSTNNEPQNLLTPISRRSTVIDNHNSLHNICVDNETAATILNTEPMITNVVYIPGKHHEFPLLKNMTNILPKGLKTPISQRSTIISNEDDITPVNLEHPISYRSTIETNITYNSPKNDGTSISRRSTVVSNLTNISYKDLKTPVNRRSTVVSHMTDISDEHFVNPISRRSTITSDISNGTSQNLDHHFHDQTTVISNLSNEFDNMHESPNYNRSVIESDSHNSNESSLKSIEHNESVFIPETASEDEADKSHQEGNTSSNGLRTSEPFSSENKSSISSQISQIQMGFANINISAKFNIRIKITQTDSDENEEVADTSDDNDDGNSRPSLPTSTETNSPQAANSSTKDNCCHKRQQKVNALDNLKHFTTPNGKEKTSNFYQVNEESICNLEESRENPKSFITSREEENELNSSPDPIYSEERKVSPVSNETLSLSNGDEQPSQHFMSQAERLLTKLYGSAWQTPDVIRTLKRTSKKIDKSSEKKNKTKTPTTSITKTLKNTSKDEQKTKIKEKPLVTKGTKTNINDQQTPQKENPFVTNTLKTPLRDQQTPQKKTPSKGKNAQQTLQGETLSGSKPSNKKLSQNNSKTVLTNKTKSSNKKQLAAPTNDSIVTRSSRRTPCKNLFPDDTLGSISAKDSTPYKENQPPCDTIEESLLDDFSFFRSNIVQTNLDSTRLIKTRNTKKSTITELKDVPQKNDKDSPSLREVQPADNFKVPQNEVQTKRVTKTSRNPPNVAIVRKGTPTITTKTRSGRQVTQRWRQLIDNDLDSDEANASDDPDADRTAKDVADNDDDFENASSDRSWKDNSSNAESSNESDFEISTRSKGKGRKNSSKTKTTTSRSRNGNPRRINNRNTDSNDIIYLDLTQDEVSIVEGIGNKSPPANHDENFTHRLEDILKTCRREEKPKIPATPQPAKTKRKLFNANFGFEDELLPSKAATPPNKIISTDDNGQLMDDLQTVNLETNSFPEQINFLNKQIEAMKVGTPIFKLTPPRNKDTATKKDPAIPQKTATPSLKDVNSKAKTPSTLNEKVSKTPTTASKLKPSDYKKKLADGLNDCQNFKYGFLKSLDVCVSKTFCHPEALVFRENYHKKKEELSTRLYNLYNEHLFDNKLKVPLVWNKKLSNTAGRCLNKKKLGVRTSVVELSEKVLTSADRLRCTLIHELCHAATWVFNGEGGHGATWKEWARKANNIFPEIPKIGVCHQYDIEYKYTYKCTLCAAKSHAHSKSKKVENIRCSYCHGAIEIFLNKKDKDGNIIPTPVREPTGFAKFVKDNYKKYKKPDLKHADVMKILGNEFAALKVTG